LDRRTFIGTLTGGLLAAPLAAEAQPAGKVYRVGVVLEGGPYYAAVDGLRVGLKELGFDEGTHYNLHIRDVEGNLTAVGETAKTLEREKVDLIYSVATGVSVAVQRATTKVPIVFYAGVDPVAVGLVKSLARPGDRITGVHSRQVDLIGKRLGILKEIVPTLRRVVAFYNPDNPALRDSATTAREATRQLGIELVERHVRTVDELRAGLRGLKGGEVDAILVWGMRWWSVSPSSSSTRQRRRNCLRCSSIGPAWPGEDSPAMARVTTGSGGWRRSTSTASFPARVPRTCRSRCPTGTNWSSTSRPPRPSGSRSRRRSCSGRIR